MLDLLPDLFDLYPEKLRLVQPIFKNFGANTIFAGEIVTVSCFNDNSRVKELVDTDGNGKIMVIDGKASTSHALLGDMLAEKAVANRWQGIVVNGCIRDVGTINTLPIAVKALGTCPIKTEKLGIGDINTPIEFAGASFVAGQYIYGDLNGLALSAHWLALT